MIEECDVPELFFVLLDSERQTNEVKGRSAGKALKSREVSLDNPINFSSLKRLHRCLWKFGAAVKSILLSSHLLVAPLSWLDNWEFY